MGFTKTKIYMLAGLGFDERLFENLKIVNGEINYLNWIEPEAEESLSQYVNRMSVQIKIDNEKLILIGHSFGGIVVQEISKIISANKTIIISSIKSNLEKPFRLRLFKQIPLYKLFNKKLILQTFPLWARMFGYNSEKGRTLFVQMINNCTDNYFKWSFDKIVNWKGTNLEVKNLFHIHGSNDKTFPIGLIQNPIVIKDGSHFMTHSKAEEVSKIINQLVDF